VSARRRSAVRRAAWLTCALAALCPASITLAQTPAAPTPTLPATRSSRDLRREVDAALEHFRARRFAEARAAFLRVLPEISAGEARDNLEFNVAVCDYELGDYLAAEQRFARLASPPSPAGADALLHAGWAALARGDAPAAERYLRAVGNDAAITDRRRELEAAIEARHADAEAAAFDGRLAVATAAYDRGDLAAADAALRDARRHEAHASERARAARDYLEGLVAHERGDDATARIALERSLSRNPSDGAVRAALGELALASGDIEGAERHYRASLDAELSPADARVVRQAIDALYPLPPPGLGVWLTAGAGYDSNATQSGSTDAVGYAVPEGRGSPFAAPAWSIEYRLRSGARTRLAPYYAGDWLLLGASEVEAASLQSHEAGVRFHLAPSASSELRLSAGGGATFSGLELAPFSLDGSLRARFSLSHGRLFQSVLGVDARPSLGLDGRDYLSGLRVDASLGERFDAGRWGVGAGIAYRYNGIGKQFASVDPGRFPICNRACANAQFELPLGYSGPIASLDADVDVTAGLQLAASARYEHRTYLDENRITGPVLLGLGRSIADKTRVDDRYTLAARAHQRFGTAPELGVFIDYTLRVSRSNVAYDPDDIRDHAFDYDDRNFVQHIVELGADARF